MGWMISEKEINIVGLLVSSATTIPVDDKLCEIMSVNNVNDLTLRHHTRQEKDWKEKERREQANITIATQDMWQGLSDIGSKWKTLQTNLETVNLRCKKMKTFFLLPDYQYCREMRLAACFTRNQFRVNQWMGEKVCFFHSNYFWIR